MNLNQRVEVLESLGIYMLSNNPQWLEAREEAYYKNPWFLPGFIDQAIQNIVNKFLTHESLKNIRDHYWVPLTNSDPKNIGIVMAGNIPMVGFHDMISVFLTGNYQTIKLSSKDNVLLPHLIQYLVNENPAAGEYFSYAENLKGCDGYIATGSNNSARYFEQYFSKYPHIIRKNRTSIAILDGTETEEELLALADDIQLYFGLGCRNITQIFVPDGYDFSPLLKALEKYDFLKDFHKYSHNYDYALTINLLNKKTYFTNGSIVLSPDNSPFSGIACLNYAYYHKKEDVIQTINKDEIQLIAGHGFIPFGQSQCPGFTDFADGIDTLEFLLSLNGKSAVTK